MSTYKNSRNKLIMKGEISAVIEKEGTKIKW